MGLRRHPEQDVDAEFDEHDVIITGPEHEAAGVTAVMVALQRGITEMGPTRTAAALTRLNQRHGFDCPGCAWPEEPGGRKLAEFCDIMEDLVLGNEIFTSRRFKQTPLASLEPIMIRFVDLCVDLKKGRMAKEGLMQYKNVSQNTNAQSIELVIKHFIKLADAKVVEAQSKADAAVGGGGDDEKIDVDDLEESETPESMLLGSVSADQNKDRTDRVLVTPWLKFLWEAYRTALDILRNNARLEIPYQQVANQALKFCLQYERKTEFRRLCEVLRQHLQNVARYSHHAHAINLTDQDTLQRHLDTRFAQLNAAVELEL